MNPMSCDKAQGFADDDFLLGQDIATAADDVAAVNKPANPAELRALEAHMEAGAVGGNPTYLLFLVIWLQATSGIDFDDINRSQPVNCIS